MTEKGIVLEVHPHTKSGTGSVQSLKPEPHGSLQNVLRYFSGFGVGAGHKKAQIQLENAISVPQGKAQPLQALCPMEVAVGQRVLIQLSPSHPIQARPWPLVCAILILGIGLLFQIPLLGFGIADLLLLLSFFKIGRRSVSYEPLIISTLDPPCSKKFSN